MAHAAKRATRTSERDTIRIDGKAGDGRGKVTSSRPTLALAIEHALRGVGTADSAEALLRGLGMAALSVLLAYAVLILTRFQVGILSLVLG